MPANDTGSTFACTSIQRHQRTRRRQIILTGLCRTAVNEAQAKICKICSMHLRQVQEQHFNKLRTSGQSKLREVHGIPTCGPTSFITRYGPNVLSIGSMRLFLLYREIYSSAKCCHNRPCFAHIPRTPESISDSPRLPRAWRLLQQLSLPHSIVFGGCTAPAWTEAPCFRNPCTFGRR